jgi:hypothetical protein
MGSERTADRIDSCLKRGELFANPANRSELFVIIHVIRAIRGPALFVNQPLS